MTLIGGTTYNVQINYVVNNQASQPLQAIGKHAGEAAHHAETLSSALKGIGAALIGSAGIGAAKHAFIDFNREVQDAKISLSAMIQGNFNATWDVAKKSASDLYTEFQRFSQMTPVTTQEMLEFGRGVAVATAQAGGGIKDVVKVTEQGVVAAKTLGAPSAYAALEITELIMGNVSKRMRFAQQLLGMAHMDEKQFKALDAQHRLAIVEKVLDSESMRNASGEMQSSFSGVLSTFEDKVQITLGRVGLPLFQKITAEITRWNKWLDENSVYVDHLVDSVRDGLVEGFEMVRESVKWIVDHGDVLISIGKVWAGTRVVGMLGSGLQGSIGNMLSSGKGAASAGWDKANIGSLLAIGTAAYMATTELMKLTGAETGLLYAIDPHRAQLERLTKSMGEWDDALEQSRRDLAGRGGVSETETYAQADAAIKMVTQELAALKAANAVPDRELGFKNYGKQLSILRDAGLEDKFAGPSGSAGAAARADRITKLQHEIDRTKTLIDNTTGASQKRISEVLSVLTDSQKTAINMHKATEQVMLEMRRSMASGLGGISFERVKEILLGKDYIADKDLQGTAHKTEINIARVEVAAKDPDRWIAELDAAAKRHLNAPRGAKNQVRGR